MKIIHKIVVLWLCFILAACVAEPAPTHPAVTASAQPPESPTLVQGTAAPIMASQPGTWVRTGGPPGGLGYDIRYNFANPDIWYVTDNFSGIHISINNGLTWLPINTGILPQAGHSGDAIPIFCLTVDPHNPQILWAGTTATGHIYRSTDGGSTWEQRDNGIVIEWLGGLTFRGFTVDPRSSNIVYAMGETSAPENGYAVWGDGTGGVVYKTIDGGEHWQKIWDGGIPSSLARYMWINPQNPDILYVSTGIFDRGATGEGDFETNPFGGLGILRSKDGGQTWDILGKQNGLGMLYIGSLFMHPQNPNILLAAAGHVTPGPYAERIGGSVQFPAGIYRTTDGGDTWIQVLSSPASLIGEAFTSVELCPSNPDIGYAGSEMSVYRTNDSGQTWTLAAGGSTPWGPPGVTAGWPIDMQCDPRNPDRVFANNYNGGNFLSEDGGRTWQNASDGYTGANVRQVSASPQYPGRVYAASRSGLWRSDDGSHWQGIFYPPESAGQGISGLEWQSIAVDPLDPMHIVASKGYTMQSFNGGLTWQDVSWRDVSMPLPFIYQIEFAPSDNQRLYAIGGIDGCFFMDEIRENNCFAPGGGVFTSTDGGSTWTTIVDDTLRDRSPLRLAIDPQDAQTVYVSTAFGLFKSADGGGNWLRLEGLTTDRPVRAVAVHPGDSRIILAALRGAGIYISRDGGVTWQPANAGLENNTSVSDIVFDPANPSIVYAGDFNSGAYRSSDGGLTWQKINDGLRMRAILDLSISADGQHLYAATEGEGVFRLDLNGLPPAPVP